MRFQGQLEALLDLGLQFVKEYLLKIFAHFRLDIAMDNDAQW